MFIGVSRHSKRNVCRISIVSARTAKKENLTQRLLLHAPSVVAFARPALGFAHTVGFTDVFIARDGPPRRRRSHLTMNTHVSNIVRTCYFELRRLASIRRFQKSTATATLVSAFILSGIDYCNSLLFGSTLDEKSHLQRIQIYAARVILRLPMSSSITTHLRSLHWLPVKVRSTYKIACLSNNSHSSTAPCHQVADMLQKKPSHTRSSYYTMPLLNRPAHSKATLGDRSFSFASSSVWNSIPNDVRCAPLLSSFKSRLKTYLFCSVYKD